MRYSSFSRVFVQGPRFNFQYNNSRNNNNNNLQQKQQNN